MDIDLSGKRALVAGAGTYGMGRQIAIELAKAGADIGLHHLRPGEATETAVAEITALGRTCHTFQANLDSPAAGRMLVTDAIAALGRIDVLVWSVGITTRIPFLKLSDHDWTLIQSVNLSSLFGVLQAAGQHMVDEGIAGRMIVVSSVNQDIVIRNNAHYCAAKGAVRQLTRAVALELAGYGITANLIAPGTVHTDFNRAILQDEREVQVRVGPVPMQRLGTPDDIAGAAVFLASPAAAYITGATIAIDGGLTLDPTKVEQIQ
jgi:NAD(P)-dependent dehydrogenase (short-subunit alcohol dehydrogenase family)